MSELHAGDNPEPGEPPGQKSESPRTGEDAGADSADQTKGKQEGYRSDRDGWKAKSGSYSQDAPDRPRWDNTTVLVSEHDYERPDGTYSFTVQKGCNRDGEKVFRIGRKNMLSFSDRLEPEDQGDWLKGMGDEPHTLYRLPQLTAAPEELVFICEGEKDADRLASLGLIATTNSSGAGKWRPDFSQHLVGREVVILPDNDEVGRGHAAKVLQSVHPVAQSVKVVELPGLAQTGDVSDWLDGGNTKEDLLALIGAAPAIADPASWASAHGQFAVDKDGNPYTSIPNGEIALAKMGARVSYDEFAQRFLLDGLPGHGPVLDDAALLTHMRLLAERQFRLRYGKDRWTDIVTDHARANTFHPVRDYLDGLAWDGVERLDGWLTAYATADDNEYVQAVGALVLMAAVRRVRKPGCKFDEMLVLESPQGLGKSSALACLAVREDWFADDLPLDSDSKVVMERTAGRWIIELAELKGMRRGEVEHAKAMISRQVDKARLAYGRLTTEQPRQCVFFGTTNDSEYLRDMTGNRRFWPVRVAEFDLPGLRRDRDQLWAEAATREAQGSSIRLDEGLWAVAAEQQASRVLEDPFHEILAERLGGVAQGKVRASDIWDIVGLGSGDKGHRSADIGMRLSNVMQALGWRRPKSVVRIGTTPCRAWVKGDPGSVVDAYPEVERDVLFPQEPM